MSSHSSRQSRSSHGSHSHAHGSGSMAASTRVAVVANGDRREDTGANDNEDGGDPRERL